LYSKWCDFSNSSKSWCYLGGKIKNKKFHMWLLKGDDIKRQIWKCSSIKLLSWTPYDRLYTPPLPPKEKLGLISCHWNSFWREEKAEKIGLYDTEIRFVCWPCHSDEHRYYYCINKPIGHSLFELLHSHNHSHKLGMVPCPLDLDLTTT